MLRLCRSFDGQALDQTSYLSVRSPEATRIKDGGL